MSARIANPSFKSTMTVTLPFSCRSFQLKVHLLMRAIVFILLHVPISTDGEERSIYKFLSFKRFETDNWKLKTNYYSRHISINAGAPSTRILEIVGPLHATIMVKYYCRINYLAPDERPLWVKFFVDGKGSRLDRPSPPYLQPSNSAIKRYWYNNGSGYWMDIPYPMTHENSTKINTYKCALRNRQGWLMSNSLIIRDIRGKLGVEFGKHLWARESIHYYGKYAPVDSSYSLDCFFGDETQKSRLHKLKYEWVLTFKAGEKLSISNLQNAPYHDTEQLWPHWVGDNGTLHWQYFPHEWIHKIKFAKCLVGGNIYYYYLIRFNTTKAVEASIPRNITLIDSDVVNIIVNDNDSHYFYLPLMVGNVTNDTIYTWEHGDQQVRRTSDTGKKTASLPHCTWTALSVVPRCFGPFEKTYTIVMTAEDNDVELNVTYNIIPKTDIFQLTDEAPSHVYGVADRTTSFKCKLNVPDEEIKVFVRGNRDIQHGIQLGETYFVHNFHHMFSNVEIAMNKTATNEVDIKLENVKYNRDPNPNFYVTCGTKNIAQPLYDLEHQVMVTILPRPTFSNFTLTVDGDEAIFTAIQPEALKQYYFHGADPTCIWTFDGIQLSRFYRRFNWKGSPNRCTVRFPYGVLRSYQVIAVYFMLENLTVDKNHRNRCIFALKKQFKTGYSKERAAENRKRVKIRRCREKKKIRKPSKL